MALTAEEYQQLLVDEFASDTVTANITRYWAVSAQDTDALTYLKTRLYIIDALLTGAAGKVSFKALDGASVSMSDYFDHLRTLRELAAAELAAASSGGVDMVATTITKTAPIERPDARWPDANDRQYRGDTYRRRIP